MADEREVKTKKLMALRQKRNFNRLDDFPFTVAESIEESFLRAGAQPVKDLPLSRSFHAGCAACLGAMEERCAGNFFLGGTGEGPINGNGLAPDGILQFWSPARY